ncbi:hypothetical protein PG994_015365 [Apiospora phragmitis]|uniref:Aminoglycoside phosphotransferase domain-containing protein n=1 Tax=Apiospora phragmitis TaxID=2905665 RepID=A0ABR1SRB3_9PEZI
MRQHGCLSYGGGEAIPVPIQGMFSYTITAGLADPKKLFQFRCEDSTLDMEMIGLATTAHPGFAPPVKITEQSANLDLSTFFAQSWNHGQSLSPEVVSALKVEFSSKFDSLAHDLPYRFTSNVNLVRDDLPTLFSGLLPFVISHGDLCEMNILVNHTTGNITGILDWAEARVLPFGFAL